MKDGVEKLSPGEAVPLWKGAALLLDKLQQLGEPNGTGAATATSPLADELCLRRLWVTIDSEELGDGQEAPLAFLRAQGDHFDPKCFQRIFLRLPGEGLALAGLGAAHDVGGDGRIDSNEELRQAASLLLPGVRYVGVGRFDPESARSEDWACFGGHRFVLPLVELSAGQAADRGDEAGLVLAVNLLWRHSGSDGGRGALRECARRAQDVLNAAVWRFQPVNACRPLPPYVRFEEPISFERWRAMIERVLHEIGTNRCSKAVLARTGVFTLASPLQPVELLRRLSGHNGTLYLFQLSADAAFVGCTPERLFRVTSADSGSSTENNSANSVGNGHAGPSTSSFAVQTEALAGTRCRGKNAAEDEALAEELLASAKDGAENAITADFVVQALQAAGCENIRMSEPHVVRLPHVQHIRRSVTALCHLSERNGGYGPGDSNGSAATHKATAAVAASSSTTVNAAFRLLAAMHPTPAVCGTPVQEAYAVIRDAERWDRGCYAGPVGYLARDACEFGVAIRGALLTSGGRRLTVFGGAGIVSGSTAEGEWQETGPAAKMRNFCALFSPLPALQELPNLNTLSGTLVVSELARLGASHFCVCPGSRSTPLAAAAARHAGVTAVGLHDERGAGFYAVGYARATGRPCVVVTSSGTAVANLLPAVVEASEAGLPMVLLTADRPPESRDCGSNQAIDQVKMFGSYVRHFRDVACPSDEVPMTTLLSTVDAAVAACIGAGGSRAGPAHLNLMYRENLAPVGGPIRDASLPNRGSEWSSRCLETPRMAQWERAALPLTSIAGGDPAGAAVAGDGSCSGPAAGVVSAVARAVLDSKRGVLVLGALSSAADRAAARWLATALRWPAFADVCSGLRGQKSTSSAKGGSGVKGGSGGTFFIGAGADALLSEAALTAALSPDVILQLGFPLVSKRLESWLSSPATTLLCEMHVFVAPGCHLRDSGHSVTLSVPCSVSSFVRALDAELCRSAGRLPLRASKLLWAAKLAATAAEATAAAMEQGSAAPGSAAEPPATHNPLLTEPFLARSISTGLAAGVGLFLSNSMPVRDMDAFASGGSRAHETTSSLTYVAANRGASGIDGILSAAIGYSAGLERPVTAVVGDMAVLHDLNALHSLAVGSWPICLVCVNNGGGGIFSFLPIARHADVFTPFFDSAHEVNFQGVCATFGITYRRATTAEEFQRHFAEAQEVASRALAEGSRAENRRPQHTFIEAVTDRSTNVAVHAKLGAASRAAAMGQVVSSIRLGWKFFPANRIQDDVNPGDHSTLAAVDTLVLLHGFMGCADDWAEFATTAAADGLSCLVIDLPGHGRCPQQATHAEGGALAFDISCCAAAVLRLLSFLRLQRFWVVGYSMGGRLAMRLSAMRPPGLAGLVVISASPADMTMGQRVDRWRSDAATAAELAASATAVSPSSARSGFLEQWYAKSLWGGLQGRRAAYEPMLRRRLTFFRPAELAESLVGMSQARQPCLWPSWAAGKTPNAARSQPEALEPSSSARCSFPVLYVMGQLDERYGGSNAASVASQLRDAGEVEVIVLANCGHAVLAERATPAYANVLLFMERHGDIGSGIPRARDVPSISAVKLSSFALEPFKLPLATPLRLSRGEVTSRTGVVVRLYGSSSTDSAGPTCCGIGEATPLPHFHKESPSECVGALNAACASLVGAVVPADVLKLDGTLAAWLSNATQGVTLPPSAHCALEMALLHLVAAVQGVPLLLLLSGSTGMRAATHIAMNALATRDGQGRRDGAGVLKLKVGGAAGPLADAQMVNALTSTFERAGATPAGSNTAGQCQCSGKLNGCHDNSGGGHSSGSSTSSSARPWLRLDANQAWSLEEAGAFCRALESPEAIDYIEEPLRDPRQLDAYSRLRGAVPFALDESYSDGVFSDKEVFKFFDEQQACSGGCRALVLKPTLCGGLEKCVVLWRRLKDVPGARIVLTSAFESGVALAHMATLAAVAAAPGEHHGLGTYAWFERDFALPGFSVAVVGDGVDLSVCQDVLDAAAASGGTTERR